MYSGTLTWYNVNKIKTSLALFQLSSSLALWSSGQWMERLVSIIDTGIATALIREANCVRWRM
jgi:hypothetical protein